ncbi:MAG: alanine racemase [Cellulomonadaceae bacterium]|nr:alanine racemase [Cellulomonadaceae bacterium]
MTLRFIGPEVKGLRVKTQPLDEFRFALHQQPKPFNSLSFSTPLLTADDNALEQNLEAMASACEKYGVWLAPHVKTHMSPDLWRRQAERGAWAPTVAMPHQLRAVYNWGVKRILLANELVDTFDLAWIAGTLASDPDFEIWFEVDSLAGVDLLAMGLGFFYCSEVATRIHPLVEVGVPGGRTGVRSVAEAVEVARALAGAGFQVSGVIGFEGPVAATSRSEDLAAVRDWVDGVIAIAEAVNEVAAQTGRLPCAETHWGDEPCEFISETQKFIVSIGGSAYIDIVLPKLGELAARGWQGVIRSGSYLTHDAVHYAELDPWSRLPGEFSVTPALTVITQVLSIPEPGLALLGAGKRDISTDLDMPIPIWWRPSVATELGNTLGSEKAFIGSACIREVNDQHAFLQYDEKATPLAVGDLVGLSPSHPCTTFDKWRHLAVLQGDKVTDLYPLDF